MRVGGNKPIDPDSYAVGKRLITTFLWRWSNGGADGKNVAFYLQYREINSVTYEWSGANSASIHQGYVGNCKRIADAGVREYLNGNTPSSMVFRKAFVMCNPAWLSQLTWTHPRPVTDFLLSGNRHTAMLNRSQMPIGSGLYAYSAGNAPFMSNNGSNLLYIGKADGARQTLRSRLAVYFRRFARTNLVLVSKHAGLDMLDRHHRGKFRIKPGALHVSWTGCAIAADLEGTLIDHFDPPYNFKREFSDILDDELIDPKYL